MGLASPSRAKIDGAAGPMRPATRPAQAWAHKEGRVNMRLHGAAPVRPDPMAYLLIQEAFARYGIAHDEARIDVLRTLFTKNAVLEVAEGHAKPFQTVTGREAMMKNFQSVLAQQADQRRHCITNVILERLTEDEASALAYSIVTVAADGLLLGASVFYAADLRREADGVWRFSRIFIGMDAYTTPKPAVS